MRSNRVGRELRMEVGSVGYGADDADANYEVAEVFARVPFFDKTME